MKRVVILGAGVIGLSVAEECRRRGHRVTVIERLPQQRDGCSFGNAGMIVPSHFTPLAAPGMLGLALRWMWNPESPFYLQPRLEADLLRWAWHFWRASTRARVERAAPLLRDLHLASRAAYERSGENCGLVRNGLLMLCHGAQALEEEAHTAAQARALGVPAEVLDARETAERDPGVTMSVAGSVWYPRDCHFQPERHLAALESGLAGEELLWETEVTGWRRDGARLAAVQTTRGEIAGDEFILASGAWSSALVGGLGLRLPMQAGKGYSVTLPQPIELPRLCAILAEARVAVTPMNGRLRVGGTMEISGLHDRIAPRRVAGLLRALTRYYPRLRREHFDGLPAWQGLRPCSPDGLPYLGRTRAAANLIVATGHAMMGMSLAPVTGALAGQLVDGETPRFDLTLLSPDRYA